MNTAEYIIKKLEELGITEIFGVPGDYSFNLLYAVENNPHTRWIGCTNELNAGYAADGYARIKGYGAIITTYGVGELSAINAIAGCMAECVPVVNIVGLPATKSLEDKTLIHHNFETINIHAYADAYKSVTTASAILTRDNAKLEIDRVFKTLIKERKPVYIAVPSDIAQLEISDRHVSYEWLSDKEKLNEAAQKIAEKISKSERPIIIGDVLIKRFDAEIEYKEFVEKSGIPVTNFLMGTNIIDMEYPKYLGGYFADLKNPIAKKYVDESDCLICVGTIYSDLNSFGFKLPFKPNEQIAIYGNCTYIEGKRYDDIKMSELLDAINLLIEPKNIDIDKPNISLKYVNTENEPLTSGYIYSRIQEFIKPNDIIIADIGTISYGIAQMKFPYNVDIETQILWASIGWATPAALGACLAKPQSRVVLITGDGAHQMTLMEVGTMLRNEVKPIIIVINNNGYTIERLLSNNPEGKFNDIAQVNYTKLARTFSGDVWATKAVTTEDFDKALKVTQIMNKMCYIEVCTDSLDALELAKEFVNSAKGQENNISEKISIKADKDKIEELILTAPKSDCEYETVVHKGFELKEDNSQKDEAEIHE